MKKTSKTKSPVNPFLDLTWMDVQEWAGGKILTRGKSYQRSGAVSELGMTKKNEIVAWVEGSARYATKVKFEKGNLTSECSCPYGFDCKHGVAVVIEYLEIIKQKKTVPVVLPDDERIELIKNGTATSPDEADEVWEDEEERDTDEDISPKKKPGTKSAGELHSYLKNKTHEELLDLIRNLAETNEEISAELSFKAKLHSPSSATLVKTVSREIDRASGEPGWQNHWDHSGFTPDYSRVISGLQKLYDMEKFDEIITLGKKLFIRGTEQVGQSDDEGETGQEIAEAMAIVFKALSKCSLADPEKIELAIDWYLADDYSLTDNLDNFLDKRFSQKTWSAVADRLLERLSGLNPVSPNDKFSRDYHRDSLTNHIVAALDNAGRTDEALALCIKEAPLTRSYDRLVTMLRKLGKNVEAEAWIRKGIKATQDDLPGIASGLRKQLLEIYSRKRNLLFCAALKADEYFERPTLAGYRELQKICEKVKLWIVVRSRVIQFLNNGILPREKAGGWPLPATGLAAPPRKSNATLPFTGDLMEVALYEKDIDEALRLYDTEKQKHGRYSYSYRSGFSDQIAEAVKEKYPHRSIELWKSAAENHIARTSPSEYSIALGYLNRILKVVKKIGKEKEFRKYIDVLKEQNRRKIRLIEMLDGLSGKPIVDE